VTRPMDPSDADPKPGGDDPKPGDAASQAEPPAAADEALTVPQAAAAEPPPATQPPPAAPREPGRFRSFVGHRVTQLVAVGLAGLLLGGGTAALLDRGGAMITAGTAT